LFTAGMFKFPVFSLAPLFLFFLIRKIGIKTIRVLALSSLGIIPILIFFYYRYFTNPESMKAFLILASYWGPSTPSTIALLLKKFFNASDKHLIAVVQLIKFSYIPFIFYRSYKVKDPGSLLAELGFVQILFFIIFNSYVWPIFFHLYFFAAKTITFTSHSDWRQEAYFFGFIIFFSLQMIFTDHF
jgi:hypothetical protein